MAGLRDLKLPTKSVQVTDDDVFVVRGLSPVDIKSFLTTFKSEALAAFDIVADVTGGKQLNEALASNVAMQLLAISPELAATIICAAADEPDLFGVVINLPIAVQVDALYKIGELTLSAEGGPKKFFARLIQITGALKLGNPSPSTTGSGD